MTGLLSMQFKYDDEDSCKEFIRLNEEWITKFFALEEADRKLADNPMKIVADGGHIISLHAGGNIVGVCALFKETSKRYQLARMAVRPTERGKGFGDALIQAALQRAKETGAENVFLLTNTVLIAALRLYRKHGFEVISEGKHPVYSRCNIVMERVL